MWSVGTGGAEVPMINITASQKAWKGSSDTIDERITTAVVVEQATVSCIFVNRQTLYFQIRRYIRVRLLVVCLISNAKNFDRKGVLFSIALFFFAFCSTFISLFLLMNSEY